MSEKKEIVLLEDDNIIAVFGTLKKTNRDGKPFGNHRVMESANGEFIGTDYVEFDAMESVGFPIVRFEQGTGKWLLVELYKVNKEGVTGPLDRLEGYPRMYGRSTVHTKGGKEVIIYDYNSRVSHQEDSYLEKEEGEVKYYNWI